MEELEKIKQEKKEITYGEDIEEYLQVNEEIEEYKIDKKHDKMIKEILQDKKEMVQFIKGFILKNFDEEIELQNSEYITKDRKGRQADIIYKVKGQDIYFLVEHQTKVDFKIPYRMLEYSIEIIRRAIRGQKCDTKGYKYPSVIPIVLYTGNRKWTANTKYSDSVVQFQNENIKWLDIEYKLIDINEFETDELLEKNTKLSAAMALEKCKNTEEVFKCFKKIIKKSANIDEAYEIEDILYFLYEKIEVPKVKKILENIKEREEDDEMSTIQERMRDWFNEAEENRIKAEEKAKVAEENAKMAEENAKIAEENAKIAVKKAKKAESEGIAKGMAKGMAKGIAKGMATAISETVKRMIKINLTDDIIKQATGINQKEIEKIRKKVEC